MGLVFRGAGGSVHRPIVESSGLVFEAAAVRALLSSNPPQPFAQRYASLHRRIAVLVAALMQRLANVSNVRRLMVFHGCHRRTAASIADGDDPVMTG
jgi:hypothetical protein